MARPFNQNIVKVLRLSRHMMLLADRGDGTRQDTVAVSLRNTANTAYKCDSLPSTRSGPQERGALGRQGAERWLTPIP